MQYALIVLFVVCLIGWVWWSKGQQAQSQQLLLTKLEAQQREQLQTILGQLGQQQRSLEHNSGQLSNRLAESNTIIHELKTKLMVLEESNKRILAMSQGMEELQNILQAPKLRGERGEIWLEELLAQMLPKQSFAIQHKFKSGEICDAVIFLRDQLILPIDSKFPLENFKKMLKADDKGPSEKLFVSDVKRRIDEIAKKYILPDQQTLGFALMYVPAENVYYQAFIEDSGGHGLQHYAFLQHVIPVSPNSLYPYLEIVLFGLKGLEIEQSARQIQQGLMSVQAELTKFAENYRKVGQNLRIAGTHYDQSDKRLLKINDKLQHLSGQEEPIAISEGDDFDPV